MSGGHQDRLSRRAVLRLWLAGSVSLTLLAVSGALPTGMTSAAPADQSGGPAPAQVPAAPPSSGATPATKPTAAPASGPAASAPVAAAPACVLAVEQTERPYYIDVGLTRSDITEGKEGLPLRLTLTVLNATSCQPMPNAMVEIWHCDAAGDYSGFSGSLPGNLGGPPGSDTGNPPPGGPGGPPPGGSGGPPPGGPGGGGTQMRNAPTNDMVFLRGGQISDAAGRVTFETIYPGWYRGRTVYIHLKVHVSGNEVHTSQLFFDDTVSDRIFTGQPYAGHTGRDTMNANDGIFQSGGRQGLVDLTPSGSGYLGTIALGVSV